MAGARLLNAEGSLLEVPATTLEGAQFSLRMCACASTHQRAPHARSRAQQALARVPGRGAGAVGTPVAVPPPALPLTPPAQVSLQVTHPWVDPRSRLVQYARRAGPPGKEPRVMRRMRGAAATRDGRVRGSRRPRPDDPVAVSPTQSASFAKRH